MSELSPGGVLRPLLGDGVHAGVALGLLRRAGINAAGGLAVSGGAPYVSDTAENAILRLAPLGRRSPGE